ncbi:AI-2E family transporter [Ruicaihuangia caeni]|uniref:AI-2E family transporter n=1 Tax=Ruicaihuangia caeni TaxID=3042517 RepID=A0AAW6T1R6_9MICO|nr:AI-2E family transporter [Klugiella sp. YN-L-19]MDI2097732.1 AI-2E family transporter [Klugiella sp. YN-L-19]
MRIHNAFTLGLFGGLGVLVAIAIGAAINQLAVILTYVGAALFIALGLDPVVSWLERRDVPRWLAILLTLVAVIGAFAGLVFALVPVLVTQTSKLITQVSDWANSLTFSDFIANVQSLIPKEILDVDATIGAAVNALLDPKNIAGIGGGVLTAGVNIASGAFGGLIVLILTLYFVSSMRQLKRGMYSLVPVSRRERFIEISEQVTESVGRYVVGQVSLALCNGVLSFVYLSIIGAAYPVLFAFVAFLFSLVPLVGTISGSVVIVVLQLMFNPESISTVIAAAIWYLIYMQVEAYVLSPNIMNRAVKVPGVLVVIGALAGGTLLGILGALVAIPVTASILIIVKQVFIPRQEAH